MHAACRRIDSQHLFCAEDFLHKIQERVAVLGNEVRGHHAESAGDRLHRELAFLRRHFPAFWTVGKSLHTPVHFFDRHLLFHGEYGPGIAKGILEKGIAASVELISRLTYQLHPGRDCVFSKGIDIIDTHGHRNGDAPKVSMLKRPPSGHSPVMLIAEFPIINSACGIDLRLENGMFLSRPKHAYRTQSLCRGLGKLTSVTHSRERLLRARLRLT